METESKPIKNFDILKSLTIEKVPAYANKFFYSLGFLSMTCFVVTILTGSVLVFFGPDWWFTTQIGLFVRSVHLWAVQAFVIFIMLHLLIVFLTSGFKGPRKLTWVLGALMFFFVLFEAEFGYVLRDDFSAQWRSLQGADLYNGSGLGTLINNLNYAQIYGVHIILIPLIILGLLFGHYVLVKVRGIAKPYKKEVPYQMVKANHTVLFIRGIVLVILLVILGIIFPAPIIAPATIKTIAEQDPHLFAKTLLAEYDRSSDTATYMDNIDPYTFDTRKIYIDVPYEQIQSIQSGKNMLAEFESKSPNLQKDLISQATDYFEKNGEITAKVNEKNPMIPVISTLVLMGKSGLYEASLKAEGKDVYNPTYVTRFLADTGVLEQEAEKLGITTEQYGMLREEKGSFPPGAWWLAPLGLMDHTVLQNDDNQDRDGAIILGSLMLLFIAFPYIPYLNRLPEVFGIANLIWKDKGAEKEQKTS